MATPPRPTASRTSSRYSQYHDAAEDDPPLQQAGRSSTNLAAQNSARSLREQARPNVLRKKSKQPVPTPSTTAGGMPLSASVHAPRIPQQGQPAQQIRQAPHEQLLQPAQSAQSLLEPQVYRAQPLHSAESLQRAHPANGTSSASTRSSDEDDASSSSFPLRSLHAPPLTIATPTPAAAALAVEMQLTPSGSGAQTPNLRLPLMQDPSYNTSTLSLTRQTTPRSVRDLGSDYTRYFNPFATRNNSQSDLSTLPRYNSSVTNLLHPPVASADLHQRLSDPFQDTRRFSDPFEFSPPTAPGTPSKNDTPAKQQPTVNEKAVAPTVATEMEKPGTPTFIRDADPSKAGFFPYLDDRLGAPDYAFPLFTDQKEDDDDLHMPQWDDDVKLKPRFKDHFTRGNLSSTIGLAFMIIGLLCVFVVLPIISYTGVSLIDYEYETPLDQMPNPNAQQTWATVNDVKYPLMSNMRSTLIDPDTPSSAKTRTGVKGDEYKLVFSDEFNAQNRTFYPGDDPYWYAFDGWYGATQDLEWYDPDAANTGDGTLQLQLDAFASHGLAYRSGMLHSWNQLCFKGGIFEVSMSLPGPAGVHGWWPGAWTMGNLGRPGYLATTDGMWPYTYNTCDSGITPNQSMTDGTSHLPGQRLPSCSCADEDHPTPGTGRGAPEIDIAEISADWGGKGWGVATQSYQVAPFDIFYYPNYDFMETPDYNTSFVNTYTGGPFQQAVSTTSMLNNNWYDGNQYQKYAFEYVPGGDEDAYIAWTIGDGETMRFDARAIGPNGNIDQRLIAEEPMSMILNFGFSHSWVDIDFANLKFPAVMRIDHVRWYQKEGEEMVTCDPPGYETTEYIAQHPAAYNNPNFTHWEDAGYSWPQNTLMNGCKA